MLNGGLLSRVSAGFLAGAGAALLFAADDILPRLITGFPAAASWLGQLLGGAWMAIAALNWLNRNARLGGIYGRPVVLANTVVYFVGAMVLLKIVGRGDVPALLLVMALLFGAFAALYAWLLFRGPFEAPHQ